MRVLGVLAAAGTLAGCANQQAIQQASFENDSAICQQYSGSHGGYDQCMANAALSRSQANAMAAQQQQARSMAMMQLGAAVASGGIGAPAPAPAPIPSILPPPPVNCTSSRDYMGQVHTVCQ